MAGKNSKGDSLDPSDPFVQFMNEMIDYVAIGICFDVHRSVKLGRFHLDDIDNEFNYIVTLQYKTLPKRTQGFKQHCSVHFSARLGSQKDYAIIQEPGTDVFGQPPLKKPVECACPNCQRFMASNRFATHLEKCLGMGRNSSRIATRRIQTSGIKEEFEIEDDFDNDWSYEFEKKGRRLRKEKLVNYSPKSRKINPRKEQFMKVDARRMSASHSIGNVTASVTNSTATTTNNGTSNNGGGGSRPGTPCSTASGETSNNVKTGPTLQALESLSQEEKIALLTQTCAAISEHTGKMCTRTGRCVQHTDDQRSAVRDLVLGDVEDIPLPPSMRPEGSTSLDQDDIHIDVDGYEDMDVGTPLLRDLSQMSWEEGSNVSLGSDIVPVAPAPVVTKPTKKSKSGRRSRNR